MKLKFNHKIVHQIKKLFLNSSLKPIIISLIFHGSGLFRNINSRDKFRDLDFELILSKQQSIDDFKIIQDIVRLSPVQIECQVRYVEELNDPKALISLSGYKIFMFFAYANGKCLIGKNIYRKLTKTIIQEQVYKSSLISAQIHYKDIRKLYLRNADSYEINKNVMRFFKEICVLERFLDYRMIGTEKFYKHELDAFIPILKKKYKNNLSQPLHEMLSEFLICYKRRKYYRKTFILTREILRLFEHHRNDIFF